MNRIEHLLILLMEECAELSHTAAKSLRFTVNSDYDGITNIEKMRREFNDILGVIELLAAEGIEIFPNDGLIQAKMSKIEKMLEESKKAGTLNDPEIDAYVKITELIGEMSFGVGLPIDMPKESPVVFDAIYRRLKDEPEYQPYHSLREREYMYMDIIEKLEKQIRGKE